MKKKEAEVRNIIFKLRLNEVEKNELQKLHEKSTERDLSAYVRKVALREPVIVKYRDESVDEILECLLLFKKELNGISNNFNQAVKKLHSIDKIPEFRFWIERHSSLHDIVLTKIDEIKLYMKQINEKWLQK